MTQEEKAKAYDEALHKAKRIINVCADDNTECRSMIACIQQIFPELKESEDEQIRKELIQYFSTFTLETFAGLSPKKIITWLEKQEGCEYVKKDWLEHIKQSWYKEGFIDGKYTPKELTINDATTLNELIDFLENGTAKLQHDLTLYANWLKTQFSINEKQGKQKPQGKSALEAANEEKVDNQNCVKPTDKAEPKFHKDEWITNGDYTWKIIEIKPLDYILQSQDGNIVDDTISHVDEQFHSFTIKDAKPGDVLFAENFDNIGGCVFLFKGLDSWKFDAEGDRAIATGYCCTSITESGNTDFGIQGPDCVEIKRVHPATKEQRDLLFQKMHEAGYMWNEEKKELEKIESTRPMLSDFFNAEYERGKADALQSIEWSEEDEKTLNEIFSVAARASLRKSTLFGKSYDYIKWQNWLKSLRDRVQLQPKQEWSEEDEKMVDKILTPLAIRYPLDIYQPMYNWLKSLKQRHVWKPSEDQMRALHDMNLTGNISYVGQGQTLIELYNDLKKL